MISGNKYYIVFDYVVGNQDIGNKYRMLRSTAEKDLPSIHHDRNEDNIQTELAELNKCYLQFDFFATDRAKFIQKKSIMLIRYIKKCELVRS